MKNKEIYQVIETSSDYRLSKDDATAFKTNHGWNAPKIKKILWGIEIMKPIAYIFIPAYIGEDNCQYANTDGWMFEDMKGHYSTYVRIDCKSKAEKFKK